MSDLRERSELGKQACIGFHEAINPLVPPHEWDAEFERLRGAWIRSAERVAEGIAQDRAARLEARMPEIEAVADDLIGVTSNVYWELDAPEIVEAKERLLALIREVAE